MKDYHINIFYSEDDEGYIADIPDLSHCSAFGETPEEALSEVMKAKQAWLESAHINVTLGLKPRPSAPSLCKSFKSRDQFPTTSGLPWLFCFWRA